MRDGLAGVASARATGHSGAMLSRASIVAPLVASALAGCTEDPAVPFSFDVVDGSEATVAAGDVTIATAADLARLGGVRRIEGDLAITMTTKVALPDLEVVVGSLRLEGTHEREVTGDLSMPALERVGGDLRVAYTKDSGRLALPALTAIGGHLALTHGTWDVDLRGLATLGGDLRVNDAGIEGLDLGALATVGGSVRVLRFGSSHPLVRLALPALTSIDGDLELSQGVALTLVAPALAVIGRDLDVSGLTVTLELGGLATVGDDVLFESATIDAVDLSGLTTVAGGICVEGASGDGLATLSLDSLATVVGDLTLRRAATLRALSLPALVDLGGALSLDADPSLRTVTLGALTETHGDLIVTEAGDVLVRADALVHVGGDLRVTDCGRANLSFPAVELVVGSVVVSGETLAGIALPALAHVGRDLVLEDLTVEPDVVTLPALASLDGTLRVAATLFLDALAAPALTTIGSVQGGFPQGDLVLDQNFALASLDLTALARVQRDVTITDNPRLPAADVAALLDAITLGGAASTCGGEGGDACPAP